MDARSKSLPSSASSPAERDQQEHVQRLQLLIDTGLALAGERDLETIAQTALDAARSVSRARFGALVCTMVDADGGPVQMYRLSSEEPTVLHAKPPLPLAISFDTEALGAEILRIGDLTQVSRFLDKGPFDSTPFAQSLVRSFLSVPIRSRSAEIVGHILLAHPDIDHFHEDDEAAVVTIAAQSASAIENAHLSRNLSQEIVFGDASRRLQRETSDRLQSVFESTTDGIVLIDRDWRFTYLNRRANNLLAPGRNLIGKRLFDQFPEAAGGLSEQHYAEAMNKDRVVEFTDYYAPLDIWASIRVFPTADGIAIFFQDVTAQRRAERASEDAARRLRQALEAGQLGTWTWDRATDMLDLDERAAFLLDGGEPHSPVPRSELRKRIVHQEDFGLTVEALRDALAAGGVYNAEYRVETRDGQQRWIASRGVATFQESPAAPIASAQPAAGNPREITGMIGTVQDITARKAQEATLRQSEKLAATGRLAATIAHEINNPLEAVTNLIYLSKTDPGVPPPIQHLLDTADNELARVAQIAQQTLGFYRDTTRPIDIDLTDLLEGVANLFSRKMDYKKIQCELDLEPDLHIYGLQGEVRQVFSNLLVNAIDASSKSSIRVRARRATQRGKTGVSVLIADQGSGIPAGVRQRLFSPFFTTKESVGTGLGLWVTRGIIEKQGGTIRFRTSTEKPTGTVFRVFLPAEFLGPEKFSNTQSTLIQ